MIEYKCWVYINDIDDKQNIHYMYVAHIGDLGNIIYIYVIDLLMVSKIATYQYCGCNRQ